jgi:predicted MFS family arabinose efflux permease
MSSATLAAEPRRFPLAAMLVLATITFTAITTELMPSGLLPQISEGLNVSEPVAGYLAAAYAAVIVVTVIPAARLLARIPRKTLLISLVLTFALSNVLVGLAPNFAAAMGARLVGGLAHGLLWTTVAPFVSRVVPADKVGKALAIVFSGNSLGMAIGAPVGTALGTLLGWRASFLFLAGFGLLLTGLAVWLLPQVRRVPDAVRPSMRKAIAQPGVKAVATAWPLLVLAHFALFTYIAPFIREAGLPDYATSLSLTVLGASGLIGIWIAGITVDSRPRRSLLITTAAIAAAMLLLPLGGGTIPGAMILMTVWGAGLGAIGIYNQAAILRAGREDRDAANGLTVLTIQLGITIGALYGSAALVVAGPLMVPVAAALPVVVALFITLAGRGTPTRRDAKSAAGQSRTSRNRRSSTSPPASDGVHECGCWHGQLEMYFYSRASPGLGCAPSIVSGSPSMTSTAYADSSPVEILERRNDCGIRPVSRVKKAGPKRLTSVRIWQLSRVEGTSPVGKVNAAKRVDEPRPGGRHGAGGLTVVYNQRHYSGCLR